MNSMVEILADYTEKQPEVIYVADNSGNVFTYAETWHLVKCVGNYLTNTCKLNKGDAVMVQCNQDALYLVSNYACELTGIVFVPIENNASLERKQSIFEEIGAKLYISKSDPLDFMNNLFYDDLFSETEELNEYQMPDTGTVAEILYTTGTTGKSKGIAVSNEANVALAENIKYGVCMRPGNTELIPLPVSHSHGIRCVYANLLNGGTVVLIDGLLKVKKIFELIEKYSVTAMDLSPSAAALLIKISKGLFWEVGKKLDYIQIGTAALPETLKEQLIENLPGVHLYNFYGSTESGRSCVLDFSIDQGKKNCIGKATVNAEIVFTDENKSIIQATEENPGTLASSGKMNMLGYWKNPELTAEIMQNGFIYTNDLGYMDEEGYIYVLGRKGDVINYNGIKIAPEEIESVACKFEGVKDAACVPLADPVAGQVPKLFISLACDETVFDLKAFSSYLNNHLDGNKLPKKIDIIEEIPRTFNGKLRRKDLIGR